MSKIISRCGARLNSEKKIENKKPQKPKKTFEYVKKKENVNLESDIENGVTVEDIENIRSEEA